MLKLRRLKVDKFRSLARGAELRFSDGINVLLGQNGTGKTTLLELISMVVRSDFSSLAKEEFAFEYELAVDEGEGAVVRVQNDRQAMDPLPEPFGLQGREVYRPSAEVFGGKDGDRLVKYDTEHGLTTVGQPSVGPAGIPSCLDPAFLPFFVAQVPLLAKNFGGRLMKASTAHRFDESLDMLKRVVGRESLGDFIVWGKQQWMPNIFARSLLPFDLVANIFASYEPNKPEYSFTQSNSSFLAALKELMGFSSSDLRVDVTAIHTDAEGYATVHLGNLSFRFGWGDGTFITHDLLSYGQKRLVAFFYYLACNPDIIIADELVNGLHHRWITASIEAIGQRQAFLTSQNPLLLDYIPFPSADAVEKSFVLCSSEPREGRPAWIWENMSKEDAQELFSAYEVGVEHVSEILQSRGLW